MGKRPRLNKTQRADEWYNANEGNIVWTTENRALFRETSKWKQFVKRVKKHECEFCTCKSKILTVHHLFPANYDDLSPEKFKCLCFSCHTKISQLSRRKNRDTVPEYFLPFLEN